MKCLVIGSGGREHALAWKLRQSKQVSELFIAPGNGGTADFGVNLEIRADDIDGLAGFARDQAIDLTVIGPEAPLAAGLADRLQAEGRPVFGPSAAAARLETSKVFAKEFMHRHRIPTAEFQTADSLAEGRALLAAWKGKPAVIKADGLAAGKGVFICETEAEKEAALEAILVRQEFGAAGRRVVFEEKLTGEEASLLVLTDGRSYHPLVPAQDHKKIGAGETGPNTGGMGAVAPNPFLDPGLVRRVENESVIPTLAGLESEGMRYRGILYVGLILTPEGPRVLEYNARFGDPETQVVLPLLENDLAELLLAAATDRLAETGPRFSGRSACSVVMASAGYPGRYRIGYRINGLAAAAARKDVLVFHAGTRLENGRPVTAGGRVLNVTGLADRLPEAVKLAYRAVAEISFEGACFRADIGRKAVGRLEETAAAA
ncbi:MAG TPA: phosphoribosylamine--glycine ligase [bacterium]|uniref:Phosphoribosylamine--glycine ligase n=1 Tax=candidate division TA06 bacterium ADurb.Bin417 TaxID=1852828 RepID=A0A1V5MIK3_UNCT6|nr:MAG: Phosphoribosylamine--glycine ligase [candidate division TA06 bacterium ADurb.Bin417]HNQ34918.1 phosphoribosylamine--glycine ligase [bacterium]HNS48176.1 phosphoribosylamine--glycine ligase [bacterium]